MSQIQKSNNKTEVPAPAATDQIENPSSPLPEALPPQSTPEVRYNAFVNSIKDPALKQHVQNLPPQVRDQLIREFDRVTGNTVENLQGLTPERMKTIQSVIDEQYRFSSNVPGSDLIQQKGGNPTQPQGSVDLSMRLNNGNVIGSVGAQYMIPLKNMPEGLKNLVISANADWSPGNENRQFNINQIGASLTGTQDVGNGQLTTLLGASLQQTGLTVKDSLTNTTTTTFAKPLLVNLDTGQVLQEGKEGIQSIKSSAELKRALGNNPDVVVLTGGVGYTGKFNDFMDYFLGARANIEIPTSGGQTVLDASAKAAVRILPIQAFDPLNPNSERLQLMAGIQQDYTTAPRG